MKTIPKNSAPLSGAPHAHRLETHRAAPAALDAESTIAPEDYVSVVGYLTQEALRVRAIFAIFHLDENRPDLARIALLLGPDAARRRGESKSHS